MLSYFGIEKRLSKCLSGNILNHRNHL
jgi:hypothetical protein